MLKTKWMQISLVVAALLGVIVMAGCSGSAKVKTGDTVKVDYKLTLDDGTVKDTSEGKAPLQFTLGKNQVIPGFENAVLGMKVGETKTVTIAPKDGYGERDESLVQTYDIAQMPEGITPEIGMQLQALTTNGNTVIVTITAFDDKTVTVDGNSELAGKNLTFKITLVEIVPPTTTTPTTAAGTTTVTTTN
jgi:peptidylprolyl isomerase